MLGAPHQLLSPRGAWIRPQSLCRHGDVQPAMNDIERVINSTQALFPQLTQLLRTQSKPVSLSQHHYVNHEGYSRD